MTLIGTIALTQSICLIIASATAFHGVITCINRKSTRKKGNRHVG